MGAVLAWADRGAPDPPPIFMPLPQAAAASPSRLSIRCLPVPLLARRPQPSLVRPPTSICRRRWAPAGGLVCVAASSRTGWVCLASVWSEADPRPQRVSCWLDDGKRQLPSSCAGSSPWLPAPPPGRSEVISWAGRWPHGRCEGVRGPEGCQRPCPACVCLHSIAAPPRLVTGPPRVGLGTACSQRPGKDAVWSRAL